MEKVRKTERKEFSLPRHDHYEELCALSVSGQLSVDESRDLAEHVKACAGCRDVLADFRQIVAEAIPDIGAKHAPVKTPPEMTERFIARARSEGVPLTRRTPRVKNQPFNWRAGLILQFAAISGLLAGILYFKPLLAHLGIRKANIDVSSPGVPAAPTKATTREDDGEKSKVAELQAKLAALNRAIEVEKRARQSAEDTKNKLSNVQAGIEKQNAALQGELLDRNAQVQQLKKEVEQLSSVTAADEVVNQVDRAELSKLRADVKFLSEELAESKALSAAANEAKDLIVARNLHIVDVHDNSSGNQRRPFGRIFYTEGQKLVFYAYDLTDPAKLNAKVSFWVWGEKTGTTHQARHLGILRPDDRMDGRWVVTFDDSRVLAQINTIFVTIESNKKEVTQPSNNRILVAFIDGAPNHP